MNFSGLKEADLSITTAQGLKWSGAHCAMNSDALLMDDIQ
jgi:hypothetical protein